MTFASFWTFYNYSLHFGKFGFCYPNSLNRISAILSRGVLLLICSQAYHYAAYSQKMWLISAIDKQLLTCNYKRLRKPNISFDKNLQPLFQMSLKRVTASKNSTYFYTCILDGKVHTKESHNDHKTSDLYMCILWIDVYSGTVNQQARWMYITYIWVGTCISPRTLEIHQLEAPFMHSKLAYIALDTLDS